MLADRRADGWCAGGALGCQAFGFLMGLPEGFVVDGVECGVAAVAADAGAEFAVDTAGEDHGVWFRQHFDG